MCVARRQRAPAQMRLASTAWFESLTWRGAGPEQRRPRAGLLRLPLSAGRQGQANVLMDAALRGALSSICLTPVVVRCSKRSEFVMWATEVKKVDIESMPKWEEKDMFRRVLGRSRLLPVRATAYARLRGSPHLYRASSGMCGLAGRTWRTSTRARCRTKSTTTWTRTSAAARPRPPGRVRQRYAPQRQLRARCGSVLPQWQLGRWLASMRRSAGAPAHARARRCRAASCPPLTTRRRSRPSARQRRLRRRRTACARRTMS